MRNFRAKPRLRGAIYCSPWCGGNCTKASFDSVTERAEKLAKHMGPGWRPIVHENLGWHGRVVKGREALAEITFDRKRDGYTAWVQTRPQFIVRGTNAKAALAEALRQADEHVKNVQRAVRLIGGAS